MQSSSETSSRRGIWSLTIYSTHGCSDSRSLDSYIKFSFSSQRLDRWKAICNQEVEHENQKIMKLCTRHSTSKVLVEWKRRNSFFLVARSIWYLLHLICVGELSWKILNWEFNLHWLEIESLRNESIETPTKLRCYWIPLIIVFIHDNSSPSKTQTLWNEMFLSPPRGSLSFLAQKSIRKTLKRKHSFQVNIKTKNNRKAEERFSFFFLSVFIFALNFIFCAGKEKTSFSLHRGSFCCVNPSASKLKY